MKRFHAHVNVDELDASIRFYSTLFGAEPNVVKPDYAKWMLEDPRINFAISQRGRPAGVDHLGLQVDDASELDSIGQRLNAADAIALAEKATVCCYARSDKFWAEDPQGVRWESFHSHGEATTYTSAQETPPPENTLAACCGSTAPTQPATSCGPRAAKTCC